MTSDAFWLCGICSQLPPGERIHWLHVHGGRDQLGTESAEVQVMQLRQAGRDQEAEAAMERVRWRAIL